jgi:hypothetical protein
MADNHFCTCFNHDCEMNPRNHDNGCDGCIKINLRGGAIPICFFIDISEKDAKEVTNFSYENFAKFVQQHKK